MNFDIAGSRVDGATGVVSEVVYVEIFNNFTLIDQEVYKFFQAILG